MEVHSKTGKALIGVANPNPSRRGNCQTEVVRKRLHAADDPSKFQQRRLLCRDRGALPFKEYFGDAAVLMADDARISPRKFWKQFVRGRVQVHWVAGDHYTMIDQDHAPSVARTLRQVLRESETQADKASNDA